MKNTWPQHGVRPLFHPHAGRVSMGSPLVFFWWILRIGLGFSTRLACSPKIHRVGEALYLDNKQVILSRSATCILIHLETRSQVIQETSRWVASPGVDFPLEDTGTTNHTNLLLASPLVANLEHVIYCIHGVILWIYPATNLLETNALCQRIVVADFFQFLKFDKFCDRIVKEDFPCPFL